MKGYNPEFYNGYKPEVGSLHNGLSGRSGGKKIFTWKFYAKGAEDRPVEVAVTLLTRDGLKFSAYTSKLPANRAALDGILNQMVILRLRLANVLSQSCVQEKLAQAASNLLFLPEQS